MTAITTRIDALMLDKRRSSIFALCTLLLIPASSHADVVYGTYSTSFSTFGLTGYDTVTGQQTLSGAVPGLREDGGLAVIGSTIYGTYSSSFGTFGLTGYDTVTGQQTWSGAVPGLREGGGLAVVTTIPEPETSAMMLAGLALVGAVARRGK